MQVTHRDATELEQRLPKHMYVFPSPGIGFEYAVSGEEKG